MSRPFRFLFAIASALILLSTDVLAQNPARTIIGPVRGVDYGPFRNGESPGGTCFTPAEIAQDLPILATMGNAVRVYSVARTPCDYYDMVTTLLANGLNVIPSAYLCGGCATNQTEVNNLIALVKSLSASDLAKIPFVVVGAEAVSGLQMTWNDGGANDLKPFFVQVKNALPAVKVATAEISSQYLAPPFQPCQGNNGKGPTDLGNTVDVIFFDIYPYSDGAPLDQAFTCILNVYNSLNSAYPLSKPIVIGETGWPTSGNPPRTSIANQQTYWRNFIAAARQNNIEYVAFEAFDEAWKGTPGSVETSWGLWDANRQPKGGIVSFGHLAFTESHDYDGDGKSDIAWRDGSGDLALWLMNGATVSSSGGVGGVPGAWSLVGQRDFNGDGKYDLLWRDNAGNTAMWFLNGSQVASSVSVGNIPTAWSVVMTGDFNGDGIGDLLWRDNSGNLAVWLMNGAAVASSAGLGNVPTAWTVAGIGDFNGDGESDLLWRDNGGNTSVWFMNGAQVSSAAGVGNIPTTWTVVGVGDFDGDGKSDIVWRDTTGNTSIWLMNGAAVSSTGGFGVVPATWSVAATGDYDGDGKSDLLWRDSSGNTAIWFMNGTTVSSSAGVGNIPAAWTVQSASAE
jgi:exo-beta-1,3-glucanase (GH17 family)